MLLFVSLLGLSCAPSREDSFTIAAAANLQYVLPELLSAFEKETGMLPKSIVGSSGKLAAQIQQGAPFDLFISADLKYPEEVYRGGWATAAPEVYAYGQLLLWSLTAGDSIGWADLAAPAVRHIALANPQLAPYGRAAQQVLRASGHWEALTPKLVYGSSVAQTNQFVATGAAEWGFTAASIIRTEPWDQRGRWQVVDPQLYDPIAQGVVVLKKRPQHLAAAQKFYTFLFSARARRILQDYGYTPPPQSLGILHD
ncbi:MAG: molybdate ABC transporter substrate-binding protein [Bacteroidota bacterium]